MKRWLPLLFLAASMALAATPSEALFVEIVDGTGQVLATFPDTQTHPIETINGKSSIRIADPYGNFKISHCGPAMGCSQVGVARVYTDESSSVKKVVLTDAIVTYTGITPKGKVTIRFGCNTFAPIPMGGFQSAGANIRGVAFGRTAGRFVLSYPAFAGHKLSSLTVPFDVLAVPPFTLGGTSFSKYTDPLKTIPCGAVGQSCLPDLRGELTMIFESPGDSVRLNTIATGMAPGTNIDVQVFIKELTVE